MPWPIFVNNCFVLRRRNSQEGGGPRIPNSQPAAPPSEVSLTCIRFFIPVLSTSDLLLTGASSLLDFSTNPPLTSSPDLCAGRNEYSQAKMSLTHSILTAKQSVFCAFFKIQIFRFTFQFLGILAWLLHKIYILFYTKNNQSNTFN